MLSMIAPAPAAFAAHDLDDSMMGGGLQMRYGRAEEIFGEGEAAEYVYKIVSGAVRTYRLLRDGRRQIDEFHFAGEVFGIETGADHRTTAEAMGDSVILVLRRMTLSDLAAERGDVARQLFRLGMQGLRRSQDHVVMLGRKSACERVAGFLLDLMARASGASSARPQTIDVLMSRQDIADYLGLTIETVSRTLSQLQVDGLIDIPAARRIVLRKPGELRQLCD